MSCLILKKKSKIMKWRSRICRFGDISQYRDKASDLTLCQLVFLKTHGDLRHEFSVFWGNGIDLSF